MPQIGNLIDYIKWCREIRSFSEQYFIGILNKLVFYDDLYFEIQYLWNDKIEQYKIDFQ